VPADYSEDELRAQAESIAGMTVVNSGFNCNAGKLLVVSRDWPQRQRLLDLIETAWRVAGPRHAYYPGSTKRWEELTRGRAHVRLVGEHGPHWVPYALVPDLDPNDLAEPLFKEEPWCALLAETALASSVPAAFLDAAVRFANERMWGTLAAMIVVSPTARRDPQVAAAVERATRELRYGAVAINTWAATVFGLGGPPWGGHASATLADVQSGIGFGHNTFMLESVEKCVVEGPIKAFPRPPWVAGHKTLAPLLRKVTEFELEPSWLKVPAIALLAMRG
jgi:acyl-CoA reductase-like NAD-dependent aldehyde dehydrogenase